MRPQDALLASDLKKKLELFNLEVNALPGLSSRVHLNCFVRQLIDSIRRIRYIQVIREKPQSDIYVDPTKKFFDPIKGAAWAAQNLMIDEAFWLLFISVHFGKNRRTGWDLSKEVYAGDGVGGVWSWERISKNFLEFQKWLNTDNLRLRRAGGFGNHRKYQSLDAYSPKGTGVAIGSYVEWVNYHNGHALLIQDAISVVGNEPNELFNYLYNSMNEVVSFGRTAKFDYLTMVGKFRLANIEPGFTYIEEATGPKRGAKLLFGGSVDCKISERQLNELIALLNTHLSLFFGMQVLEDALCNWQKNPGHYIRFSG